MELLLAAFHFLHFVEVNAFGYTMSTVTDRKNIIIVEKASFLHSYLLLSDVLAGWHCF